MGIWLGFCVNWLIRPVVGVFVGQATIYGLHELGLYPEQYVAEFVLDAASSITPGQLEFIRWSLAAVVGVLLIGAHELWKARRPRSSNITGTKSRTETLRIKPSRSYDDDPTISQLRTDVKRTAWAVGNFEDSQSQESDVTNRIARLHDSDHPVWLDTKLFQARVEFIHWCRVALHERKQFGPAFRNLQQRQEVLARVQDAEKRLDVGLQGAPVPAPADFADVSDAPPEPKEKGVPDLIPLDEAAQLALEETEDAISNKYAVTLNQDNPLGYFHHALTEMKGVTVYAKRPPSRNLLPISREEFAGGFISDDGKSVVSHNMHDVVFSDLHIERKVLREFVDMTREEDSKWHADNT